MLRLADGSRVRRRFLRSDTMGRVLDWADVQGVDLESQRLSSTFPKVRSRALTRQVGSQALRHPFVGRLGVDGTNRILWGRHSCSSSSSRCILAAIARVRSVMCLENVLGFTALSTERVAVGAHLTAKLATEGGNRARGLYTRRQELVRSLGLTFKRMIPFGWRPFDPFPVHTLVTTVSPPTEEGVVGEQPSDRPIPLSRCPQFANTSASIRRHSRTRTMRRSPSRRPTLASRRCSLWSRNPQRQPLYREQM